MKNAVLSLEVADNRLQNWCSFSVSYVKQVKEEGILVRVFKNPFRNQSWQKI